MLCVMRPVVVHHSSLIILLNIKYKMKQSITNRTNQPTERMRPKHCVSSHELILNIFFLSFLFCLINENGLRPNFLLLFFDFVSSWRKYSRKKSKLFRFGGFSIIRHMFIILCANWIVFPAHTHKSPEYWDQRRKMKKKTCRIISQHWRHENIIIINTHCVWQWAIFDDEKNELYRSSEFHGNYWND